jgi:hypothetical protein
MSSSKLKALQDSCKVATRKSQRRPYRLLSRLSVPSEAEMEPVSLPLFRALQANQRRRCACIAPAAAVGAYMRVSEVSLDMVEGTVPTRPG